MTWAMFGHAINKIQDFQLVNLQWGDNSSRVMQNLDQQQKFLQSLLCFVLYGHYYMYINYIPYDQNTANKEHECEYDTQLGRRKIISCIIYYYYLFLQKLLGLRIYLENQIVNSRKPNCR